jgi:hypothetical protein
VDIYPSGSGAKINHPTEDWSYGGRFYRTLFVMSNKSTRLFVALPQKKKKDFYQLLSPEQA